MVDWVCHCGSMSVCIGLMSELRVVAVLGDRQKFRSQSDEKRTKNPPGQEKLQGGRVVKVSWG